MTQLLFEGDLTLWQGALFAAILALGVYWLYRRDVARRSKRMRWLLPSLRIATAILIILMLTGPVVHRQVQVGDVSRVLIIVDESQSMSLNDASMRTDRRLLNCVKLGLLHESTVDVQILQSQIAQNAASIVTQPESPAATNALSRFDELSRWKRVEFALLNNDNPLLTTLHRAR